MPEMTEPPASVPPMVRWRKEHVQRIRTKAEAADGLGTFWRGIMLAALDAVDAECEVSGKFGVALLMIREGAAEPPAFAARILNEVDGWNAALAAQPPEPVPQQEMAQCSDAGYTCGIGSDQTAIGTGGAADDAGSGRKPPPSAESAPPQPGDAERLADALARQLAGHFAARSIPTWETIHAAARELREVGALRATLDAAQSALAKEKRDHELTCKMHGITISKYEELQSALAESRAEVERLRELFEATRAWGAQYVTGVDDVERAGNFLQWLRNSTHPEPVNRRELAGLFAEARGQHETELATATGEEYIDIVFDGPPGPESGRFVEVESPAWTGIRFGEWIHRPDGYWVIRFQSLAASRSQGVREGIERALDVLRRLSVPTSVRDAVAALSSPEPQP